MVAQVLYRKWRPQTFDDVVGQRHIIRTLRNALVADEVAHAYLFAGPRGTGKTTTARLLAKAVNCVGQDGERPCNQCVICQAINTGRLLDLIEIDAASNRGIDEIRDLRAKVNFSPSQARYKVYILDEAHMLTNEAFNALLKTLEEPPGHVIFVLVTTEPHRLPTTITSRCQRFDFHRLSLADIVGELERIAGLEGVSASGAAEEASQREALELIARSATGSLRDAISLLDQVITAGGQRIALEQVQEVLGTARMGAATELVSSLIQEDVGPGLQLINQVIDQGADARQFTAQVVEYLHSLLLLQVGGLEPSIPTELIARMQEQAARLSTRQVLDALRLFNRASQEIGRGPQPQLPLELALVEAVLDARERRAEDAPLPPVQEVASEATSDGAEVSSERQPAKTRPEIVAEDEGPYSVPPPIQGEIGLAEVQAAWPHILRQVRSRSVTAEALLKACEPVGVKEKWIILGFQYPILRDKVEEQANRVLIEEVIGSILGGPHFIHCVLGSEEQQSDAVPSTSERVPDDQPVPSASPVSENEGPTAQADGAGTQDQSSEEDRLAAVADDPVVQTMVNQYGARVVDVQ